MTNNDTIITLIGSRLAKEGLEFIFEGESAECSQCKLKNICTRLEKGRNYRIIKVRDSVLHDCQVHDVGVLPVEVTKAPVLATVQSRKAVNSSKLLYESPKCNEVNCKLYQTCHPKSIRNGDKCMIVEVLKSVEDECKKGYSLKKVKLQV